MNTKQELIREASTRFAQRGFDGTSIRDIAEAAGANLATINYHSRSKDTLFTAVVQQAIESLIKTLDQIGEGEDLPTDNLSNLFREYTFYALHKNPGLKAILLDLIHGTHHLPPQAIESLEQRDRIIVNIVRERITQGAFRRCNVNHTTWIFFGTLAPSILCQPFLKPKYKRSPYTKADVEKIVDSTWNIFINGMKQKEGDQHEN